MAKLPAWLWLTAGIIVTLLSFYVGNLPLFVFIGILFLAIGIYRQITEYAFRTESGKHRQHPIDHTVKPSFSHPTSVTHHPSRPTITTCPSCQSHVYTTAHFCHHCGIRLH